MFEILPYTKEIESRWDRFVMEESVNGTFLQTRRFLNYHPAERFKDASFVMEKSGIIVAVFPGNETPDGAWISHQGSTFGGPVISNGFYSGSKMLEIVKTMDEFLTQKYKRIKFKPTAKTFCKEPTDLLEYALEHEGYERHSELSAYTLLDSELDPLECCKRECRHNFRLAEKNNLTYREIKSDEMETFYKFLEISKAKYNTKPVHTLAELEDLQKRLPGEILFRGIWQGEQYLSGLMMFAFNNAKAVHFQYLAPDESFKQMNATTVLFVEAMREAAKNGYEKFSWGISTENGGKFLNENLFRFKESFGSKAVINPSYTKGDF